MARLGGEYCCCRCRDSAPTEEANGAGRRSGAETSGSRGRSLSFGKLRMIRPLDEEEEEELMRCGQFKLLP